MTDYGLGGDNYKRSYTEFDTHEALHTVYILMEAFERHVLETTCAHEYKDVERLTNKVLEKMGDLYQLIGSKR